MGHGYGSRLVLIAGPVSLGLVGLLTVMFACAGQPDKERSVDWMEWRERVVVAEGEGHRGPWRMNDSDWRYVDDPHLDLQDDGTLAVIWGDQGEQDIVLQLFESDRNPRLTEPTNISQTPDVFSWLPKVVLDPDNPDRVYVLWQEINFYPESSHGGDVLFAKSTDGGQSFTSPTNLLSSPAGAGKGRLTRSRWDNGSLDMILTPDGELYAAWTEFEGPLWVSRSSDRGETFEEPVMVAGGDGELPARAPALAAAENGSVYLAWTVGDDPEADIHLTRLRDGLPDRDRPRVIESDNHSDAPAIGVDDGGTVHLVYGESVEGFLSTYEVLYTTLPEGNESFEDPTRLSQSGRNSHYPSLALDGAGGLWVSWYEFSDPGIRQPEALGLTHSGDGGERFREPGTVAESRAPSGGFVGSLQGLLGETVTATSSGGVVVINSTFVSGDSSEVEFLEGRMRNE